MYSFEFTMAQTPNRMRGIMMGVVLALQWAGALVAAHLLTGILEKVYSTNNYSRSTCYLALPLSGNADAD